MFDTLNNLDHTLFVFLNGELHSAFFDWLLPLITNFGNTQVPLAIAAVALFIFGKERLRTTIVLLAVAVAIADLVGYDLKLIVGRLRPYKVMEGVRLVGVDGRSNSFGFPSNHAINMFAAAAVISMMLRRWWVTAAAYLVSVIVGWSRVYTGVHFPFDVLAGALLGTGVGFGTVMVHRHYPVISRDDAGHVVVNYRTLTAIMVFLSFLYRYSVVLRMQVPLAPEEAQYWDWSRRLDWSYFSKPPLIAWLLRVSTTLFGNTAFAVRGTAVTLALAMTGVTWVFVQRVFRDDRVTFASMLMLNLMPLYAIGALIMTTDTPLLFFWALCCWLLYEALVGEHRGAWYGAAVAFGFGLLAKYAMIYIVPCLFLFLAVSPAHRHWLRRKEPYLFLLVGAVMFLPVIFWSAQHGWVNIQHIAWQAEMDRKFRLTPGKMAEFLGGQALLANPFVFAAMLWFSVKFFRQGRWCTEQANLFLILFGAPVFLLLLLKSCFGSVLGNWAAPAYYTWPVFAVAEYVRTWKAAAPATKRRRMTGIAAAAIILPGLGLSLIHEPSVYAILYKGLRAAGVSISVKTNPAYQMTGYDRLGAKISGVLERMPNPERTFIFAKRYQETAELAFYVRGNPQTYNAYFGDHRLNQYVIWGGLDESKKGWDAIYVTNGDGDRLKPQIADQFDRVDPPVRLVIRSHDVEVRRFTYWRCHGFHGAFPKTME